MLRLRIDPERRTEARSNAVRPHQGETLPGIIISAEQDFINFIDFIKQVMLYYARDIYLMPDASPARGSPNPSS
jgi:hypothetical protein